MAFGKLDVEITAVAGPSTADRNLVVVFYYRPMQYGTYGQHVAYRVPVTLPEGKASVKVTIPHVQSNQVAWDVAVFESGRDIEDKRGRAPNTLDYQYVYHDGRSTLGFLVDDDEPPAEIHAAAVLLTQENANNQNARVAMPGMGGLTVQGQATGAEMMLLSQASVDWRLYLPNDAWILSANTLRAILNKQPRVADALRNYVACGGRLLVFNARDSESLADIDRLLDVQLESVESKRADVWTKIKQPDDPWWEKSLSVNQSQYLLQIAKNEAIRIQTAEQGLTASQALEATLLGLSQNGQATAVADAVNKAAVSQNGDALRSLRLEGVMYDAFLLADTWVHLKLGAHNDNLADLADILSLEYPSWYLSEARYYLAERFETEAILKRSYLNGTVLVSVKPLPELPTSLHEFLARSELYGSVCHQVSDQVDGNWFWKNMIAAVGKPPVWIFCGIVSLFALILGPGLLFVTGRLKRRSLMIFLVPAFSSIATLIIVAYGVFHEGFETYVRVSSVQFIDPATGRGFAWSRQNYFSGLPPREGIVFAEDTYARPVASADSNRYRGDSNPRKGASVTVDLSESQRWIGWLKAREQQQLMIGHPLSEVSPPLALEGLYDDSVSVRNCTAHDFPLVVLRGADENYYYTEALRAGDSVVLRPLLKADMGSSANRIFNDIKPQVPEELRGGSMMTLGSRRGMSSATINDASDALNQVFTRYLSDRPEIPPFGFAVVQTHSDQVEVPVEGKIEEGTHVILGVQPW
ncbi:MAG: hypothetical protein R3C53_00455 [Pirellulaceae bacterium]